MGYHVALIEKTNLKRFKAGESLSPGCERHLNTYGIGLGLPFARPYQGISSSWGAANFIEKDFGAVYGEEGVAILKTDFELSLVNQARLSGVRVLLETNVTEVLTDENSCKITIQSEGGRMVLHSLFCIQATGRSEPGYFSKRSRYFTDRLITLTSIVDDSPRGIPRLYIESMPDGWFYSNCLPGGKRVLSYFTDYDLLPGSRSNSAFLKDRLAETNWWSDYEWISRVDLSPAYACDARSSFSSVVAGSRWIRLGDAAYTVDPLSGQGILKNLLQVTFLTEEIERLVSGTATSLKLFNDFIKDNFLNYFHQQMRVYASERRWPESKFWSRRLRLT